MRQEHIRTSRAAANKASGLVIIMALLAGLVSLTTSGVAPAAAADRPLSVAIIGDSLARGYCRGLRRLLRRDDAYRLECWAHPSSGLTRPDFFDWSARLSEYLASDRIDLAIVSMGANDAQRMVLDDRILDFEEQAWADAYGARVEDVIAQLDAHGAKVIWVGMPIARSDRYARRMARLNEIYISHVEGKAVTFLSLWEATQDETGRYAAALPDASGRTRIMRDDDGIHFTGAGEQLVSCMLLGLFPGVERAGDVADPC